MLNLKAAGPFLQPRDEVLGPGPVTVTPVRLGLGVRCCRVTGTGSPVTAGRAQDQPQSRWGRGTGTVGPPGAGPGGPPAAAAVRQPSLGPSQMLRQVGPTAI